MVYDRESLASYENLKLAWIRIQTSTEYDYKRLTSDAALAFSWNLESNLKHLASEISENIYEPSKTSKYYLPKKTGLVRPIAILSIKDQIFYQAIVNLICKAKYTTIKSLRQSSVFGGFNIKEPDSKFFLTEWKYEYNLYKQKIKQAFQDRKKWIAKFDLASFYDVIDHQILIDIAASDTFNENLMLYKLRVSHRQ